MTRRYVRGFALLVVLALAAPVSSLADAGPVAGAPSGSSCVSRLEAVQQGSPEARIASTTCFATFAAAISFATDGKTVLPANAGPDFLTQAMLPDSSPGPQSPATSYVIGIDWDFPSQNGYSRVWEASTGCDVSHWWVLSYVGDDWNDRIESAKGYSGCVRYRHYQDINYGGAHVTCSAYCSTMGSLADQTSSEQFDDAT